MKILFLCGSLEPGRDGVGDYVRLLGEELKRQEHQVGAIALYDIHIKDVFNTGSLIENEMPVLRLPSCWSSRRRFRYAQQLLDEFQPNWISLQFVPYAFDPKGLPILLSWHLRSLVKGKRVHLMMHETWVGTELGASWKLRLLSFFQKAVIKNIITQLSPEVIHTHLPMYRYSLRRLGWEALPLPLFSNIPVSSLSPVIVEPKMFRIGIFSQIDNSNVFIDFLSNLVSHMASHNLRSQVILIGGQPKRMQVFKDYLANSLNLHDHVHYTGFLDSAHLSATLQSCHLGLTPIPRHALGKSGTVAAFLLHGVSVAAPILNSGHDSQDIGFFSDTLKACILLQPNISGLKAAQKSIDLAKKVIRLNTIANTFIYDLTRIH